MTSSSRKGIDLRVIAGVVLVIVSVMGVTFLLSQGKKTQAVYVAAQSIPTGHPIAPSDVTLVHVALGEASENYIAEGELTTGSIATHAIRAGEFIPERSLSTTRTAKVTSVVIELTTPMPQGIGVGSSVDLWSAMAAGQGVYATPSVLVTRAELISEVKQEGITAFHEGAMVEILIPADAVASVLEAQANKDAMSVVPSLPSTSKTTK